MRADLNHFHVSVTAFKNLGIFQQFSSFINLKFQGSLIYILGHYLNDVIPIKLPSGSVDYKILKFYADWDEAQKDN